MKQTLIAALMYLLFFSLIVSITPRQVSAQKNPHKAVSFNLIEKISSNCPTIKSQIKLLQISDLNSRIHLGSNYSNLSEHFITPLNLRLVSNHNPNQDLIQSQTDLEQLRSQFSKQFTDYSHALKNLIDIDCISSPNQFSQALNSSRQQRQVFVLVTKQLKAVIKNHRQIVLKIKENLQ